MVPPPVQVNAGRPRAAGPARTNTHPVGRATRPSARPEDRGPAQAAGPARGPARREPWRAKPRGAARKPCGAEGVAMITLGGAKGAARQAALGGIAASLVIGLAACGNTVAGPGTAGSAGTAPGRAAARPSAGAVNPGGPRIPASAAAQAAMCREIPGLTRMTAIRSTRPSGLHVREVLPRGFTIRDPATVRQLATQLCALPRVPAGRLMCPNMTGASYRLFFFAGDRAFPRIGVGMSGCRVVTGLGAARSWSGSTALEQALARQFGIHFLVPPY